MLSSDTNMHVEAQALTGLIQLTKTVTVMYKEAAFIAMNDQFPLVTLTTDNSKTI